MESMERLILFAIGALICGILWSFMGPAGVALIGLILIVFFGPSNSNRRF